MHFTAFEIHNLKINERISFSDLNGNIIRGEYKGNYSRTTLDFYFLNYNGGLFQRISLTTIQNIQRV